jgi:UDP-N-acetylmuramate--alanine ligase
LAAARRRYPDRRIWAVFQPHTFSRTRHMLYRMGESFDAADQVIVTDIYAARELDDGSIHARELVAASAHHAIRYIGARRDVAAIWASTRRRRCGHHAGRRRRLSRSASGCWRC